MGYKLKRITIRQNNEEKQIRPKVEPIWLCFTANTANSTVQLTKQGNPTSVTLEKSTNGKTWESYTIGSTITLTNIGDKIYLRNTSESTTGFSNGFNNYYQFVMTGSIAASGDTTSLLNKNGGVSTIGDWCFQQLFFNCTVLTTPPELPSTTLGEHCYRRMFCLCSHLIDVPELPATTATDFCYHEMFLKCTSLTTVPALPATTVSQYCYYGMFSGCTKLEALPELPALDLVWADYCYYEMFYGCSKIKLSTTQTGEYQTPYRIPPTGTGTTGTGALNQMFYGTGGTFTSNPSVNTTYYTSNTVVS